VAESPWAVEKSLKRFCFASLQFCYAAPSGLFFGVFAGVTKLEGRDIAVFFAVFNSLVITTWVPAASSGRHSGQSRRSATSRASSSTKTQRSPVGSP
jgi:hypothetical protein